MTATNPPSAAATPAKPKRRILRRACKALALAFVLLALAYGGLCWWYYSQAPRLARNYAAELNAPILKIPPEKRAWTHYRRALEVLEPLQENEFAEKPTDKDWPATAAYLKRNAEALAMIRETAKIRPLGMLVHDGVDPADIAWKVRRGELTEEAAANSTPPSENPPLVAAVWKNTVMYFELPRLVTIDSRLAAEENDGERFVANLMAIFDIGEQGYERPFLVDQLIASTIRDQAVALLGDYLAQSPQLFSEAHLVAIARRLDADGNNPQLRIRLDGEKTFVDDMIQRYYTDGGDGDGWFTIDGDFGDEETPADEEEFDDRIEAWWDRFRIPLWAVFVMPPRRELQTAVDEYFDIAERLVRGKPWSPPAGTERFVDEMPMHVLDAKWEGKTVSMSGIAHMAMHLNATSDQEHGAVAIAAALVRFQRRHGRWPASVADVVPEFLSEIPLDQFTGQPLLYKLIDGKPVVYSVGADSDDDGGQQPTTGNLGSVKRFDDESPSDGDWILWPPIESTDDLADEEANDLEGDAQDGNTEDDTEDGNTEVNTE